MMRPMAASPDTLYLIDGTAQLYRAYFAISGLTNAEGMSTNAVYGFTTMLRKLLREEGAERVGVAFDVKGPVFRHEVFPEYKANRPPTPEDLKAQVPYAKEVCESLGVPVVELSGYEADDLIATYATQARAAGLEVVVVASDKDLMQLVGEGVTMLNPSKELRLDADGVASSFGVPPELVRDVLALMGDSVDNVPGVPGVGQKTALSIAATYGDLDAVIERASRFGAAFDARDRIVEAIETVRTAESLNKDAADELAAAASALSDALEQLIEVERDDEFRERWSGLAGTIDESGAAAIAEQVGAPGKKAVRPLAALKREAKALDRGSNKRHWYAIRDNVEQARLSKELVTLDHEAPVPRPLAELTRSSGDPAETRRLFRALGFTSLLDEIEVEGDGPAVEPRELELDIVGDAARLEALVAACREAERVALTVSCGSGGAQQAALIGIALSHAEGAAAFVPLGHAYLGAPQQLPLDIVQGQLGPLLADPDVPKVANDLKWLLHILRRHGMPLEGATLDTMLAAFLLNAARSGYGLATLAGEFLGTDLPEGVPRDEATGEPVEQAAARHGAGAEALWRLAGLLRERLEQTGLDKIYDEIDGPLLPILAEMERRGVRVDTDRLAEMSAEMERSIETLRAAIHKLAGSEFNVDSPKQLREILFEKLGLVPRRKTAKSKAASTDAQTLEELAAEHEIAGKLLEYRELTKLKSTYVDSLPRLVHPETGRIHTSYHPTGAATGRLSSSDPNLQNIPVRKEAGRKIREAFVAEEGFVFLASDYSQIELRVLAHVAADPDLIAAFRAGEDIHRLTAARIFDVMPGLVTDDMRRRAKAVNFGVLYGMSEMRLAREQGIPRADARRFIQTYFERFGRVRAYIDDVKETAQREGAVRTLFGRVRPFPQLQQKVNRAVREQALRAAVNTTCQGTAADLMKLAMLAVSRALREAGSGARMLLQVHDELLLEVPVSELEAAGRLVREAMEGVGGLDVPLVVDQKSGPSWLEAT
jgi:DNA polymerase-1